MSPCRYPSDMANENPTGRESDKFMLRLPDGMRELLKAEAKANNRTMNSEIVSRLWKTLETPLAPGELPVEGLNVPLSRERLAEIIAMLESGGVSIVPAATAKITGLKKG